jgi:hypothetical protein
MVCTRKLFSLVILAALCACGPKDPLAKLTAEDRDFLFSGPSSNAAFLGQPIDVGPISCNPQRMNQGYVLMDIESGLWLDSIRPSGVERHKVVSVEGGAEHFVIHGQNGVGVGFSLVIDKTADDSADISWDGAPAVSYRRCPGMPA